jgi:hypothetical protein
MKQTNKDGAEQRNDRHNWHKDRLSQEHRDTEKRWTDRQAYHNAALADVVHAGADLRREEQQLAVRQLVLDQLAVQGPREQEKEELMSLRARSKNSKNAPTS